jgi:hypothetical protein
MIVVPCFELANHNDWSTWFVINNFPPICNLGFNFIVGVTKNQIIKLECENYFYKVTTKHCWECFYIVLLISIWK